jgi:hypothetical protein
MTSFRGFNLVATKCCGSVYSTPRYSSINASAFEYWTDGARVHSLMPTDGGLRRCKCGTYFLISTTFKVGFEEERSTPSPEFVKDSDLSLLLAEELTKEVEIVVRRRYWRYLNEPYRDIYRAHRDLEDLKKQRMNSFFSVALKRLGIVKNQNAYEEKFTVPDFLPTSEFRHNLERLLELVQQEQSNDYLEISEIFRELSRFDEAAATLNKLTDKTSKTAALLQQLVGEKANAPYRYKM